MGVRDVDKYGEIKDLLGIPSDEPIFIIRGQDMLACPVIETYRTTYNVIAKTEEVEYEVRRHFSDHLLSVLSEFHRFEVRRPSAMKIPD